MSLAYETNVEPCHSPASETWWSYRDLNPTEYPHCKCGDHPKQSLAPFVLYIVIYYPYNFYVKPTMHILMVCWT